VDGTFLSGLPAPAECPAACPASVSRAKKSVPLSRCPIGGGTPGQSESLGFEQPPLHGLTLEPLAHLGGVALWTAAVIASPC
jgi:hypothetical protein